MRQTLEAVYQIALSYFLHSWVYSFRHKTNGSCWQLSQKLHGLTNCLYNLGQQKEVSIELYQGYQHNGTNKWVWFHIDSIGKG